MKRFLAIVTLVCTLALPSYAVAHADNFHVGGTTGQPDPMHNGIQCAADGSQAPGHSGSSPGSPFNPSVNKRYAGNPGNPNPARTGNTHPVSQYDVACFQQASH
ncbi:MAG: hypothetical protein NVS2B16_22600 [Chloroflexota bacterium]